VFSQGAAVSDPQDDDADTRPAAKVSRSARRRSAGPKDPPWVDLVYVAIALLFIVPGGWFFLNATARLKAGDQAGFVADQTAAAVLIGLGVAILFYRVLHQQGLNQVLKLLGSGAAGAGFFTLTFFVEGQSLAMLPKFQALIPAAKIEPAPVDVVAVLDHPEILQDRKQFADSKMRLQVFEPWNPATNVGEVSDSGLVAFGKYLMSGQSDQVQAELKPDFIQNLPWAVQQRYKTQFCVRLTGASWQEAGQITLDCALGQTCRPRLSKRLAVCPRSVARLSDPLRTLLAPTAYAAPAEPSGWAVPTLDGDCAANQRLDETFYRFDVRRAAPAGASFFTYALRVNGIPIYLDGDPDYRAKPAVAGGQATLAFGLQNLQFAGAAGPKGGWEAIDLSLRFYGPKGGAPIAAETSQYRFIALRPPPPQDDGRFAWRGQYVFGKKSDGYQMFVHSGETAGADVRADKTKFDAYGLIYPGGGGIQGPLPVRGIVRPSYNGHPPGVAMALVHPDRSVQFTYALSDLKLLAQWYAGQRAANSRLGAQFAPTNPLPVHGEGSVSPAAAGCPKA